MDLTRTKPWKTNNAGSQPLGERIRLLEKKRIPETEDEVTKESNVDTAWSVITERRKNPLVEKEIWLVVGNAFSRSHFEAQLARGNSAISESKQAFQLINSWAATCAENEVGLKIFVSE